MTKKSAAALQTVIVVAWKSDTVAKDTARDKHGPALIMKTGGTLPHVRNARYLLVVSSEAVKGMKELTPTQARALGITMPKNAELLDRVVVVNRLPQQLTTRDNSALVRKHTHDLRRVLSQRHWEIGGRGFATA